MASRAFTTSSRQLRKLTWNLEKTTADVTWLTEQINDCVDHVAGLEDVANGQVNGNPHPTPGKDDPYHGTVELFKQTGERVTSAHGYPNGYVRFSKAKFKPVKLAPHPKAPVIPPAAPAGSKSGSKPTQQKK